MPKTIHVKPLEPETDVTVHKDEAPPPADGLDAGENAAAPEELANLGAGGGAGGTGAAAAPAEPPKIPSAQLVNMLLMPILAVGAPNWNITPAECQQLSTAYAAVLDKYFPDGITMGPEITAIAVTAMIVAPRLLEGRPLRQPPKKKPEASTAGAGDAAGS